MRIRKMFVGVDAALSPAMRNCKIARIFGENVKRPVGADDPVRSAPITRHPVGQGPRALPEGNAYFAAHQKKNTAQKSAGMIWSPTPTN